jgi:uncharacterized protein YbjT (DUF2867 family)
MILVTSAFGNQGKKLIPRLVRAGEKIRALRQTPNGEADLKALGAHEVVIGDACDAGTLRKAMSGVDSVYHIGPSAHPKEREMGFAVIEAALHEGVKHLVFSSVLHAIVSDLVQHEIKRDIEERLVGAPINFTILQPADYMQVLRCKNAFETGEFVLAWDVNRRQSVIDVADIAEVAAKVLTEGEPHYGATYELSSPGCFTAYDIAAIIAKVAGREITVKETSPEARMKDQFGSNLRDERIEHGLRLYRALRRWYSEHDFVGNPNVLTMLLGRTPTTLEAFIRAEYALFKASS